MNPQLVDRFEGKWSILENTGHLLDLEPTAFHPRLRTELRLCDHLHFVAEHDDHHIARILTIHRAATR